MVRAIIFLSTFALGISAASAEDLAGPVLATVIDVLDGDTFTADALIWPGQRIRINVRIRGIDAPEMHARCGFERAAAEQAKAALAALIADEPVEISHVGGAKYYGRVLADVQAVGGVGIAETLLARNLVRRYDGGRRQGWCR